MTAYRYCKWCQGKECLYCESESNKDYKTIFPDGPNPIATFDLSTPEGVKRANTAIGPDAIKKAFGKGGGGIHEVLDNIAKAQADK